MRFTSLVTTFALALGAIAAPVETDDIPSPHPVYFQMWNGDCGAAGAHTMGSLLIPRSQTDLCFPLAEDTHALGVSTLAAGCRLTAYKSPLCDDYPEAGSYTETTGCLFTSRIYKSWKLTCA